MVGDTLMENLWAIFHLHIINKVNLRPRLVVIMIVMMYIQQNIDKIVMMNMSSLEVIWKLA